MSDILRELIGDMKDENGNYLIPRKKSQLAKSAAPLPDLLGLFDVDPDPEQLSIPDSFDPLFNKELLADEAREALSTEAPDRSDPFNIQIRYVTQFGDVLDYIVPLNRKYFSLNTHLPGITGKQVYSILSYLVDKKSKEMIMNTDLLADYLQELEQEHMQLGTAVELPATIHYQIELQIFQ